jgi:osmoprotectant transport system substrate-binding protein
MQTLNARADVDGDEPADIARDYLIEQGFITE